MTTKELLTITLTLGIIGLIMPAYADEQRIQVPFTPTGMACEFLLEAEPNIYACYFYQGDIADNALLEGLEPIEPTAEEVVEEEIIEQAPEPQLTRTEKDIQRMIDKITLDLIERPDKVPDADKQLLELLLRAQDECKFGVEEGAPIQDYEVFAIPEGYFYPEDTDFAKYNMLGKIVKLVQACTTWDEYKGKWLGPQYIAIQEANDQAIEDAANRIVERDTFAMEWMTLQNITITDEFMNRAISDHDVLEEAETAQDYKCSALGKQRGFCPEGIGPEEYKHDTSTNKVLSKYLQYRASPETAVGETRYDVTTDPKCYTLASFAKQHELDEESRKALLIAGGCTV